MFSIFTPQNAARKVFQSAACAAILVFSGTALGEEVAADLAAETSNAATPKIEPKLEPKLEIVVTATRSAKPISQVGSSITVIQGVDIEKRGKALVIDVLRQVPGLSITRNGGPGSTTLVRLRGADSGHTMVLIDGVRVNDPASVGGTFDFNALTTLNIERIEILRGPQSALYGSDAMGGVINIITKRGSGKPRYTGRFEGGSFNTFREKLGVSGSAGIFDYAISGEHFYTNGISAVSENQGATEKDSLRSSHINANFGLQVLENYRISMSGSWSNSKSEYDDFNIDGPNHTDKTRLYGQVTQDLSLLDDLLDNTLRVYVTSTERDFEQPNSPAAFRFSTFEGMLKGINYQADYKVDADDVATFGIQSEQEQAKTGSTQAGSSVTDFNDTLVTNSVYGQYQLGLFDNLHLTAGGRRDDNQKFGNEWTFRLTGAYFIEQTGTTLRASYGSGANAPTLYQLFHPLFGNPGLQVEKSRGTDLGIEQSLYNGRVTMSVTGFINTFDDLIDFDFGTFAFLNVDKAVTRGVETSIQAELIDGLLVNANHTFTRAKDKSTGLDLRRRPRHMANVSVDYQFPHNIDAGVQFRYVGTQFDGSRNNRAYRVFDLNGNWAVKDYVTAYARVENLLNEQYSEVARFGSPGRAGYGGVRVNF